jgi:alpha-galactosidase
MSKIAVIGAGSVAFSMSLIQDFALTKGLSGCTVTFMDINQDRLNMVYSLASRYIKELDMDLNLEKTTSREEAIREADFVINTVKVDGYDFMEAEREIAEKHGYYRGIDDKVSDYYGGFFAYKQLNFFLDLARDVERISPNAWFMQVSNPVFEGTNIIARETGLKVAGFCHGAQGYKDIVKILKLNPEEVEAQVVGLNHCNWLTRFLYRGNNAYPLIDEWIEKESENYWKSDEYLHNPWGYHITPAAVEMYKLYGVFPVGDSVRSVSPWWFNTDLETKEKYFSSGGPDSEVGWTMYLFGLKMRLRMMEELAKDEKTPITEKLPPRPSGEVIVPFIDSIINNKKEKLILNIPNNGAVEGLPDDVVVEIPVTVGKDTLEREKIGRLPSRLMLHIIIPRWLRMEIVLQAFRERDKKSILLMLMEDHRTKSLEQVEALIEDILSQPWNGSAKEHYR